MPPQDPIKNTRAWPVLKDYTKAALRYPNAFLFTLATVIGVQVTEIIAPLFLRQFIDTVSGLSTQHVITPAVIHSLVGYICTIAATWLLYRLLTLGEMRIESRVPADLTNKAFGYLIHHNYDFFVNNFAGTLTRRVTRYARAFEQVFDTVMSNFIPTFVYTIGVIVVLYTRNHALGIGLLLWTLFFLALIYFMTQWRYKYKLMRAAEDSRLTGALSDSIGNHTAVLFFAAEAHEKSRIGHIVTDWFDANIKAWSADLWNYTIQGFLTRVAQVSLLLAGLYLWQKGLLTVGDFILIQIYMLTLMDRIGNIGSSMRRIYDAFAEANEMIHIFELPHAITDDRLAVSLIVSDGKVEFGNVNFSFIPERPILKDFSLTVKSKEKVALVGPSGAGKSTITKLLLRLYDLKDGAIKIDNLDIRHVTQKTLRESISFVPQEPVLFHRTLHENIAYGRQDASLEEIIEAAKKAHAHEFISTLPLGYDTFVGERGVKLSGGERQRVAIARAILKNAPILVLDEATSSLDSESEHLIQEALDTLMGGKTVIVIAHRLSTIMKMDRIVVMEQGSIVAQGTHEELLAQAGLYKKLWSIQAGGFLGGEKESGEEETATEEGE
ncbi:MAG: hypothetical protein JWO84_457 [Parcubacteria group bacterium]|nr:hypothetical protein [Parcubacteria group bacterium]